MNTASFKTQALYRVLIGVFITFSAILGTFQAAEANSFHFYNYGEREHEYGNGEHEGGDDGHGGCGGGGGGTSPCITTNYALSLFAYDVDQNITMDGDLNSRKLNISIAYPDLNNAFVDNAWLWIKAKDDSTSDSTAYNGDGKEYLDLLKVEDQSVSVDKVEVDTSDWFFKFNVKNFITGSYVSPLDALIASVNLEHGQSDLIFQNARLDIDYHTVYCPPPPNPVPLPAAAWLFGSALLGFVSLSNRRKI